MDESYPSPSESVVGFDKIFHPVDAVELELEGSIAPPILGTRRINKRRLNISPEGYGKGEDLGVGGLSVEDDAQFQTCFSPKPRISTVALLLLLQQSFGVVFKRIETSFP